MNKTPKRGTRFLSLSCYSLILLTGLFAATGAGLPQISAYTLGNNFGISLDQTCLTMLKNNVSSDCPTYEDILTLFPDTSNQKISGEFGYHDGLYQRGPEKLARSFEYYRFASSPILFVDPLSETATRIKMIEIKSNLNEYLLRGAVKSYNAENNTLTLGHGRYVDSCRIAYVDASQWAYLVGDSINYLSKGCTPDSTTFNSKTTTQLYKVKHDITTSYKYKLAQFQKESIEQCGKKVCLYEKVQPTPP